MGAWITHPNATARPRRAGSRMIASSPADRVPTCATTSPRPQSTAPLAIFVGTGFDTRALS